MYGYNVSSAIARFSALDYCYTFDEKRREFNVYLEKLSLSSQELEEFGDYLLANKPCVFSVDILLHFEMYRHVLQIIKSNNGPLVGRILKDWSFFASIFNYVTPEELVDDVLPLLSFKIRMRVINRICKVAFVKDVLISDRLFVLLENKYGITTASVIIPACSLALIEETIVKYNLKLSGRQLWTIFYNQHPSIVEYYFDHLVDVMQDRKSVVYKYKQLVKEIASTNSTLFWELVEKFQIPVEIGKYCSKKLLTDRDVVMKYADKKNDLVRFPKKQMYQAAVKLGIQNEYVLTFYPEKPNYFMTEKLLTLLEKFVPRTQRFTLTKALYEEKYPNHAFIYPDRLSSSRFLNLITVSEREAMLDKLENKEDLIYFYTAEKSVPMIKEKIQSASDLSIKNELIITLFTVSNINNYPDSLLDVLNSLYEDFRKDSPSFLSKFMNNWLPTWKQFNILKRGHWEIINKILNYIEYLPRQLWEKKVREDDNNHFDLDWYHFSDEDFSQKYRISESKKTMYFQEYFKYLVDNSESTDEFLQTFINESLEKRNMNVYNFNGATKYTKIFHERIKRLLKRKNDHKHYKALSFIYLENIVNFDKKNPGLLNLMDYLYILDLCDNPRTSYDKTFLYIINKFGIFHDNIKKYYGNHFTKGFYNYCIKKSPKDLFKTNDIFYNNVSRLKVNILDLLKCPYLKMTLHYLNEIAVAKLVRCTTCDFSMKFVCLLDEERFVNYIRNLYPPKKGKISGFHNCIIKCLPLVAYPQNMTILEKYFNGDQDDYEASLYKILFRTPNIHVETILNNMYNNSNDSIRTLALDLGRRLLPKNSFYTFLEMVNNKENNPQVRFALLKKANVYFVENRDDKFYQLFLAILHKIDNDKYTDLNYLLKHNKIPKSYLHDYIKQICQKIKKINSSDVVTKQKIVVLNSLPDYVFDNLNAAFIADCFEEHFFEITEFALKCLLNSKSDKHCQLIFEKFKTFLSGDVRSQHCREKISQFVRQFCEEALKKKAAEKFTLFYLTCRYALPEHSLINHRFLIEFTQKWFESQDDMKVFARKCNNYLVDTVKLYPHDIGVLCNHLRHFLRRVNIDEFEFLEKFFYTNTLDETYIAAISFFPNMLPTLENHYHMYVPLLNVLEKIKTPVVVAHLDLYYGRTYILYESSVAGASRVEPQVTW